MDKKVTFPVFKCATLSMYASPNEDYVKLRSLVGALIGHNDVYKRGCGLVVILQ